MAETPFRNSWGAWAGVVRGRVGRGMTGGRGGWCGDECVAVLGWEWWEWWERQSVGVGECERKREMKCQMSVCAPSLPTVVLYAQSLGLLFYRSPMPQRFLPPNHCRRQEKPFDPSRQSSTCFNTRTPLVPHLDATV